MYSGNDAQRVHGCADFLLVDSLVRQDITAFPIQTAYVRLANVRATMVVHHWIRWCNLLWLCS